MYEILTLWAITVSWLGPVFASYFCARIMRETDATRADGLRSACDNCGTPLRWYELIPIFSYPVLRGKCSKCKARIDVRIWLAELLGLAVSLPLGLVVAALAVQNAPAIQLFLFALSLTLIAGILIYLAVYDLFTLTIPADALSAALVVIILLQVAAMMFPTLDGLPKWGDPAGLLVAIVAGGAVWAIVKITRERGMGMGDVYLVAILGLMLGWPRVLVFVYTTIGIALIAGLIQGVVQRKFRGLIIPLVPCLVLGYAIALTWGIEIIKTLPNYRLLFPTLGT